MSAPLGLVATMLIATYPVSIADDNFPDARANAFDWFAEQLGRMTQEGGLPRNAGRILSLLLLSGETSASARSRRSSISSVKESSDRPSNIGACRIVSSPPDIRPQTRPTLRESTPRSVSGPTFARRRRPQDKTQRGDAIILWLGLDLDFRLCLDTKHDRRSVPTQPPSCPSISSDNSRTCRRSSAGNRQQRFPQALGHSFFRVPPHEPLQKRRAGWSTISEAVPRALNPRQRPVVVIRRLQRCP